MNLASGMSWTVLRCVFLAQLQGTKAVDESHDQETTDLHKCISHIRDCTPDLDKSNVRVFFFLVYEATFSCLPMEAFDYHFSS